MIESIHISEIASYGNSGEDLTDLSKFNFLFGSNASGKTTISRIIAEAGRYPTCTVKWKGETRLQPLVYNNDFVEKNFTQSAELPGVFTLGEKQADVLEQIAATKGQVDELTEKIEGLTKGLVGEDGTGGKKGDIAILETGLKDKCWAQKQKHDEALGGAFEGYRGSAEKFKNKVLKESASNTESLITLAELQKRAKTVFGPAPITEEKTPDIDTATLLAHETDPALNKRVIGKEDVDIAAMIRKLENSDWVREGREFYDPNQNVCPFCQQRTSDAFSKSLNDYFDETFVSDIKAIDNLAVDYETDSNRLQEQLASIISSPSKFLDVDSLKIEKELLDAKININKQLISGKKKEPSRVVKLESISNVATKMKLLVDTSNGLVAEHNSMVKNLSQEAATLTAQVWKYVLEELKSELAAYKLARSNFDKAVTAMNKQIAVATAEKTEKTALIRGLERQTTSVQPTIDGINALLSSFGFQGFSLAKAENQTSYILTRADGSDAKTTLSEGEKNFVTFLYFYHLLKGSNSESGMTTDRIVVFDDPVSSLDSDILFIVGNLIKGLFDEVRTETGHIKQVFILTHNVYFHKEVTFNSKRRDRAMNEETFWIIRRLGMTSKIEKHESNPIKTSYELLWAEVRNSDRSNLTIQNTMRRILENYFKILGGSDPDQICAMFEGKNKLICKSLFSWVNDGSHFAHDDLYVSIDDSSVETYLNVFRKIFEKSGHSGHYMMMMGDDYVELTN